MKQQIKIIILFLLLIITSFGSSYAQENNYTIKHLDACNNELSNFGTTYFGNNKIIYASPDLKHKVINDVWNPNQQPFLDLFIGELTEDGEIINGKQLVGDVKTKYHEADVIFTKDLQTVYFTRDNYYNKKRRKGNNGITNLALFKADVNENGEWINIVEFPYNDPNFSIGHPALSTDENVLYFISDMPGSLGKTDIYKVNIKGDNTYSLPENLGPKVNTIGKEMFPYISKKEILYFSSDGWKGKGGLDIYAYNLKTNAETPNNLGSPINSYEDDFAFLINEDNNNGYFSSKRGGGKGDDDIYYFEQTKPIDFNCTQEITGIVKDKNTGRRIPNALVVLYDSEGKELQDVVVGENAKFSFPIDCSSKYRVEASKYEYSIDNKEFESNADLDLMLELNIEKGNGTNSSVVNSINTPQNTSNIPNNNPYQVPEDYIVNNPNDFDECQKALYNIKTIYFDLDKSYIRPDASEELEMVVLIMKRCKNIIVEAGSHTDSRASHSYNLSLSKRRSISTRKFIITRGISPSRIKAKGYGETELLNDCSDGKKCTEKEHQLNRRTEFIILNR